MLIAFIFVLLLIAVGLVWYGWREESILVFGISFLFSIAVFIHHMTDVIGLSL